MNRQLTVEDFEADSSTASVFDCIRLRMKKDVGVPIVLGIFTAFFFVAAIVFGVKGLSGYSIQSVFYMGVLALIPFIEYALNVCFTPLFIVSGMMIAVGGMLGEACNLYYIFPKFDEVLHTLSGFVFACFGFCLARKLCDDKNDAKSYFGCVGMALAFSLGIALLWELFELGGSTVCPIDMEEDSLITKINTYFFTQNRGDMTQIENITKTVIYYGDGESIVVEGGYLDIGFYDTVFDMLVCTIGAIIFAVLMLLDRKLFKGHIREAVVPEETYPFRKAKKEN